MVQTELKNSKHHEINLDDDNIIESYEEFEKLIFLIEKQTKQEKSKIKKKHRRKKKLLANLVEEAQFNPRYYENAMTPEKAKIANDLYRI